jgi:hypothetical protein
MPMPAQYTRSLLKARMLVLFQQLSLFPQCRDRIDPGRVML